MFGDVEGNPCLICRVSFKTRCADTPMVVWYVDNLTLPGGLCMMTMVLDVVVHYCNNFLGSAKGREIAIERCARKMSADEKLRSTLGSLSDLLLVCHCKRHKSVTRCHHQGGQICVSRSVRS